MPKIDLKVIFRFLVGKRDSILRIASRRESIWVAIVLVMLAGIARQYDQTFVIEAPLRWFIGPLAFSAVTGTILYSCVVRFYESCHPKMEQKSEWRTFMGCYWMTAPLAWLYAIPVERFFSPVKAVVANLVLFGVVAVWRVALMGRVISVVTNVGLARAIGRVGIVAALEYFVVALFTSFGNAISKGMMGMENSPEETVVLKAVQLSINVSLIAVLALPVFLWISKSPKDAKSRFASAEIVGVAWRELLLVAAVFAGLAIYPQIEQARSWKLARLFESGQTRAALDFLAQKGLSAFAPSRPIPPKLYEMDMYQELGKIFTVMRPNDPDWLQAEYLEKARIMFSIRPRHYHFARDSDVIEKMFAAISRLPIGVPWLKRNREIIEGWIDRTSRWFPEQGEKIKKAFAAASGNSPATKEDASPLKREL